MSEIQKSKTWFFDRKGVEALIGKHAVKSMSKVGAFLRRRMRSSMRRRKGPSKPGQPPSAHDGPRGPLLKEFLFFALDPATMSVVVGPTPLGKGEAPQLNEYGGTATRTKAVPRKKAHTKRQAAAYRAKVLSGEIKPPPRKVTYAAKYPIRAFAGPALEAEVAAGTITGAFGVTATEPFAGPGT